MVILPVIASQELILRFSATSKNAGNLTVKKKTAHTNPEAPGASKVTKLERGGHLVQRNLVSVSKWSELFLSGRNLTDWTVTNL